ncbi:MAG: ABC transporter permease [Anaerolineae bacterium]|nr:ABC transporter permease [Anaerolineae bacterium]
MLRYLLGRLVQLIPTFFGIYTAVFIMMRVLPGDPALFLAGFHDDQETLSNLRAQLKLDEPVTSQYVAFLTGALRGDLGKSYISKRPVTDMLAETLPQTIALALAATAIAVCIGVPLGILSAMRKNSIWDSLSRLVALIGVSIPIFWLGLQLQIIVGLQLNLLPISGVGFDKHLILPAISASMGMLALLTRMTRSNLLEVLNQDYIRTARSKGLRARVVILRHALSNVLLPVITVWGTSFAGLLSGTLLVEVIFSWPGMGRLLVQSISTRDYPMVQGIVIVFAVIYSLMNLLVDLSYPLIDPRIRYRD